jgi:uncharacterized membrane protein
MQTPATVARHPLHPMLIVFPLGLWLTAVAFDIATLVTGGPTPRLVAFYLIGAGLVGALLAAVPGFVDYFSLQGRAGRLATWHMGLNLAAVAVFLASLLLRTRWGESWVPSGSSLPQALSIFGAVVLIVSGWLGGHLVYVHRVGVEDGPARRDEPWRRRAA